MEADRINSTLVNNEKSDRSDCGRIRISPYIALISFQFQFVTCTYELGMEIQAQMYADTHIVCITYDMMMNTESYVLQTVFNLVIGMGGS